MPIQMVGWCEECGDWTYDVDAFDGLCSCCDAKLHGIEERRIPRRAARFTKQAGELAVFGVWLITPPIVELAVTRGKGAKWTRGGPAGASNVFAVRNMLESARALAQRVERGERSEAQAVNDLLALARSTVIGDKEQQPRKLLAHARRNLSGERWGVEAGTHLISRALERLPKYPRPSLPSE